MSKPGNLQLSQTFGMTMHRSEPGVPYDTLVCRYPQASTEATSHISSILYTSYAGSSYGCALSSLAFSSPRSLSSKNILLQRLNSLDRCLSAQTYCLDSIFVYFFKFSDFADLYVTRQPRSSSPLPLSKKVGKGWMRREDVHADSQHHQA